MEDFKIENRYLKLCYVLCTFISCVKTVFQRPAFQTVNVSVDQKTQPSIFFKTHDWAFETFGQGFKGLGENWKLGQVFQKLRKSFNVVQIIQLNTNYLMLYKSSKGN